MLKFVDNTIPDVEFPQEIEYWDREKKVVCVGTFYRVTNKEETDLKAGQLFISPYHREGRESCAGYMMPILMTAKEIHSFGYGNWRVVTNHGNSLSVDMVLVERE